ncbi:MAG: nucleotidyltransferase family protein [archaeon]
MDIVIVAGGLATRMGALTETLPKCLLDVQGKPLIQHQLEHFREHGYKDIIFCTGHLGEKVRAAFGDGRRLGMKIRYVREAGGLLGTAGCVRGAAGLLPDEPFLAYYGDCLSAINLDKLMGYHKSKGAMATICCRPLPKGYKSSSAIVLDSGGLVRTFLEKPGIEELESLQKGYINSGIYVLERDVLDLIPKERKYDFAKQLFPEMIRQKLPVFGYVSDEFFAELGRVDKYARFIEEHKSGPVIPGHN